MVYWHAFFSLHVISHGKSMKRASNLCLYAIASASSELNNKTRISYVSKHESHKPDAAVTHTTGLYAQPEQDSGSHLRAVDCHTCSFTRSGSTAFAPRALTQCKTKSPKASTQAYANRHQQHGRTSKKGRVVSAWLRNTWTGAKALCDAMHTCILH